MDYSGIAFEMAHPPPDLRANKHSSFVNIGRRHVTSSSQGFLVRNAEVENNLLYLSYGHGPHEQELVYSVVCALHMLDGESGYRIIICTDNPKAFHRLPVQIRS